MLIAIITVAWITGAVSTAVAVIFASPGVLGAMAIFAGTGVAGGLLSAVAFAYRPAPRRDADPAHSGAMVRVTAHR